MSGIVDVVAKLYPGQLHLYRARGSTEKYGASKKVVP